VVAGRLEVGEGALAAVRWDDLRPIDVARPAPKGDPVAAKDDALTPEAQREYDDNMLWFGGELLIGGASARVETSYTTYLGKYRREIDVDDFFHRVGRDDLAAKYANRHVLKIAMTVGGFVIAIAGTLYPFSGSCQRRAPGDLTCLQIGLAVSAVGGTAGVIGLSLSNEPAPPDRMRRMVDEYNAGLRRRLQAPPRPSVDTSITFAPYVVPGGGGGALVVRF
jgi:hypothetical protein